MVVVEHSRCQRRYFESTQQAITDGLGRVSFVCPLCSRNKRGLCRDCSARLSDSHAMRCTACARSKRHALELVRDRLRAVEHYHRNIASMRRRKVLRAFRLQRRRYMRLYREENPRDKYDRAYNRWYMTKRRSSPTYRDRQNARKRELRASRREAQRLAA